jgi:hypothetical protein
MVLLRAVVPDSWQSKTASKRVATAVTCGRPWAAAVATRRTTGWQSCLAVAVYCLIC